MPTDIAVLERAIVVMAICMALQTLLFIAGAFAAFVAWQRASQALVEAKAATEAQVAELRTYIDRMAHNVDEVASAVVHGASTVDGVVADVRDAMGTVSRSVGSVASAVTAPRAALALGLFRGYQVWQKRRAAQRLEAAATSEL